VLVLPTHEQTLVLLFELSRPGRRRGPHPARNPSFPQGLKAVGIFFDRLGDTVLGATPMALWKGALEKLHPDSSHRLRRICAPPSRLSLSLSPLPGQNRSLCHQYFALES
jgi:hypothetical protein